MEKESDFEQETVREMEQREVEIERERLEKEHQRRQKEQEGDGVSNEKVSNSTAAFSPPNYSNQPMEKLEKILQKLTHKITLLEAQKTDKDENKTTSLGTSKINYLDPRISVAWCKKHDVPVEKIFTKTLRDKFKWALVVDSKWKF